VFLSSHVVVALARRLIGRRSLVSGALLLAAAGAPATLAQTTSSTVYWGNDGGANFIAPPPFDGVLCLSAGSGHVVSVYPDGGPIAWGANGSGQCNVSTSLGRARKVVAYGTTSLVLQSDGTIRSFGTGGAPGNIGSCLDIDGFGNYGAAVRGDGVIWTFGSGVPAGNPYSPGMRRVAAGGGFVLGIRQNGTIAGWGPSGVDNAVPAGLDRVVECAGGGAHAVARLWNGTVRSWSDAPLPVDPQVEPAIAVDAGPESTVVLRSDGRVFAWGKDAGGNPLPPVPPQLGSVSAVTATANGVLAVVEPRMRPQTWSIGEGGNDAVYGVVLRGGMTFDEAIADAATRGGRLASITSAEENAFVYGLVWRMPAAWFSVDAPFGVFIGARQAPKSTEPAGGWQWLTGEPWNFTAWINGEPNNTMCTPTGGIVSESVAQYVSQVDRWNDVAAVPDACFGWIAPGYVIEYTRDCDGDGLIDAGEVVSGTAPDVNRDLIPDNCQCIGADLTADGLVGAPDLAVLLGFWGTSPAFERADIDRNGIVDGLDLATLLAFWGACAGG